MAVERFAVRTAELGDGLLVRRALPHRDRRTVGAWCFFDHLGPLDFEANRGLRVGPHPHIGLQTFTWMIEGEVVHRDSLGNEQVIRPGQVNLMSAARGIAHAEDSIEGQAGRLHAVQLWIALDDAHRHAAPSFRNYPELPVIEHAGLAVTLLAGNAFGKTSPVEVFSPLVGMDAAANGASQSEMPLDSVFEYALLVLTGVVDMDGERFTPDALAYLAPGRNRVALQTDAAARFVLIGGPPFDEDILLWWNFVARTREEIEVASSDWNLHRHFGEVLGSPSRRLHAPDLAGVRLRTARG